MLREGDYAGADFARSILSGAVYDLKTKFPAGFNPGGTRDAFRQARASNSRDGAQGEP